MKTKNIKPLWAAACISMIVGTWDGDAGGSVLPVSPTKGEYLRIADEVAANLQNHILDKFFPAAVDEKGGGFYENCGLDWTRQPGDAKSIVYQSRLTWTSANQAAGAGDVGNLPHQDLFGAWLFGPVPQCRLEAHSQP
jgi:hypothetical protein